MPPNALDAALSTFVALVCHWRKQSGFRKPQADPLDGRAEAQTAARALFEGLKEAEKNSVLGLLGRLGHPALKHKVGHRADLLMTKIPGRFPDLKLVADEAVNCRNHYVHGGGTDPDLAESYRDLLPFLTDTLEFVFGASEFVEAGWDFESWAKQGTSMTHPWGAYCVSYRDRLPAFRRHVELRKAVEKAANRSKKAKRRAKQGEAAKA